MKGLVSQRHTCRKTCTCKTKVCSQMPGGAVFEVAPPLGDGRDGCRGQSTVQTVSVSVGTASCLLSECRAGSLTFYLERDSQEAAEPALRAQAQRTRSRQLALVQSGSCQLLHVYSHVCVAMCTCMCTAYVPCCVHISVCTHMSVPCTCGCTHVPNSATWPRAHFCVSNGSRHRLSSVTHFKNVLEMDSDSR